MFPHTYYAAFASDMDRANRVTAVKAEHEGDSRVRWNRNRTSDKEPADTDILAYAFDFQPGGTRLKPYAYRKLQLKPAVCSSMPHVFSFHLVHTSVHFHLGVNNSETAINTEVQN